MIQSWCSGLLRARGPCCPSSLPSYRHSTRFRGSQMSPQEARHKSPVLSPLEFPAHFVGEVPGRSPARGLTVYSLSPFRQKPDLVMLIRSLSRLLLCPVFHRNIMPSSLELSSIRGPAETLGFGGYHARGEHPSATSLTSRCFLSAVLPEQRERTRVS